MNFYQQVIQRESIGGTHAIDQAPVDIRNAGRRVALQGVWKEYDDFVAVADVNFTLEPGEFLTLLGPSGSGKTSTLMMVAGFESATRGSILVNGVDVASHSPKQRNFGVVFQGYALFPHMTVLENVEFPLRMRGIPAAARCQQALDMIRKVGLESFVGRKPRELSGGQQQRVALARALVFQPDALLLDEPLGALDKNMREQMQEEIKNLQKKIGISILFVTHDQSEAMTMSDRIAVMNAGRIVQIGTPQEVYYRPATPFVASFFGETNLVPCTARGIEADRVIVELPGGVRGPALRPPCDSPVSTAQDLLVSMRPERIRVLRETETADVVLQGQLIESAFLGRHFKLVAAVHGQRYSVLTNDLELAQSARPSMPLKFGWMLADAQALFPEAKARQT